MQMGWPKIIQGGMGIAVSQWKLAREVSMTGQLGVVSLVGAPHIIWRKLQRGDRGGHIRRALEHFPLPEVAERVLRAAYIPGGKASDAPYRLLPIPTLEGSQAFEDAGVCAAFSEIWLAKEGHEGLIGLNLLEKVQLGHGAILYGAMLAGVDVVIVGAGIPVQFAEMLNRLAQGQAHGYQVTVHNAGPHEVLEHRFDPAAFMGDRLKPLKRPAFFPIVASTLLAKVMTDLNQSGDNVQGFVVEGPTAGGHNAPPRGRGELSPRGEPVYGKRDVVDFGAMRALGVPFWWAGGCSDPAVARAALEGGAAGIQVGSIFALCEESDYLPELKAEARRRAFRGELGVFTHPRASPSGYPFKVAELPETLNDPKLYEDRPRLCDLGAFRQPFKREDGSLGYRCPAEPVAAYVAKGGRIEETTDRVCLCNALAAVVGHPQTRPSGYVEPSLMTMGDDTRFVRQLMKDEDDSYPARAAVDLLLRYFDQPDQIVA